MKLRHFVGLLLVAAITSLAWPADSQAFPRRGFYDLGPNYSYSYPTQLGGGIGMGASYYGMPGWGYGAFPSTYSPYTAPYPLYNILPPGYPHGFGSGYGTYGWMNTYGSRRTAEDYGYSRDYFDQAPRRRTSLYPALPNESLPSGAKSTPKDSGLKDQARINITVPDANAIVLINGKATTMTGRERSYITPALEQGYVYKMRFEVSWKEKNTEITRVETFSVRPGTTITHTFE